MTHIIWDWNGTLFDDLTIVVQSVNAALDRLDAGPIDADGYRDHYTRPVHLFYDKLLDRPVTNEEWELVDQAFHEAYRNLLHHGNLAHDARPALESVIAAGQTQSLLSMWWHTELVPMARRLGIDGLMTRIDGHRGDATGQAKAALLAQHLAALAADLPDVDAVVIGDSLDDARAAETVGIPAVLFDGGTHHRKELEAAGVPVAGSLLEAVSLAGIV